MRPSYHQKAVSDLDGIWDQIALRAGERVADDFVDRIDDTIVRVLLRHPNAGLLCPELGEGIRSFPVVPYQILYRCRRARLTIARIVHGRRNIRQPLTSLLTA